MSSDKQQSTNGTDAKSPSGVKIKAGCTLTQVPYDKLSQNTWCRISSRQFQVRTGPDYKKNKKKAPSLDMFYHPGAVDIFKVDTKQSHLCRNIIFPDLDPSDPDHDIPVSHNNHKAGKDGKRGPDSTPEQKDTSKDKTDHKEDTSKEAAPGFDKVPTWFVVNFQIPYYDPPNPLWGSAKEDGPGFSLVLYYHLRPSARKALRNPECTNAVKLLRNFFAAPDKGDGLKQRLKAIPKIINPEDCHLGIATKSLVSNYNAKPFMTGPRCHTFHRGENYLECDVDVHRFCWAAKKGAWNMLESISEMVCDIGFVVEAHDDSEMPEQMMCCTRISLIEIAAAKSVEHWQARAAKEASEKGKDKDSGNTQQKEQQHTNGSAPAKKGGDIDILGLGT